MLRGSRPRRYGGTTDLVGACVPRLDFSFSIRNDGADELELVAIEQDVYDASGALIQLRLVDESGAPVTAEADRGSRIPAGEGRTIRNPLPEFAPGTPLESLVYRFVFRTTGGRVLQSAIRFSPIPGSTSPQLAPTPPSEREQQLAEQEPSTLAAPSAEVERPTAPTPRQLARSWFETLYGLGIYASA